MLETIGNIILMVGIIFGIATFVKVNVDYVPEEKKKKKEKDGDKS